MKIIIGRERQWTTWRKAKREISSKIILKMNISTGQYKTFAHRQYQGIFFFINVGWLFLLFRLQISHFIYRKIDRKKYVTFIFRKEDSTTGTSSNGYEPIILQYNKLSYLVNILIQGYILNNLHNFLSFKNRLVTFNINEYLCKKKVFNRN